MIFLGVEMPVLVLGTSLVVLLLCCCYLLYWLYRPDQPRYACGLVLFVMLLAHNLALGLFPNPYLDLPEVLQHWLLHGSGFAVACYLPFYFYRVFGLSELRYHARSGVLWFMVLPFVLAFGLLYPMSGRLDWATGYGMLVPLGYGLLLLVRVGRIVWGAKGLLRRQFFGVLPWPLLAMATHLEWGLWLKLLLANGGLVWAGLWLIYVEVSWYRRREKLRLLARRDREEMFMKVCRDYGLTEREAEVAYQLCLGLSYDEVGEKLFISHRTVDSHAQRIYLKLDVKRRLELQRVLGMAPAV